MKEEVRALHMDLPLLVEQALVAGDVENIGEEDVVRSHRDDLGDAALERDGALCNGRGRDGAALRLGEAAFLEFIHLCPRKDARAVHRLRE